MLSIDKFAILFEHIPLSWSICRTLALTSPRKSDEVSLAVWKNIEGRQERHRGKGSREYWDSLVPCTGRPLSAALCRSISKL